MLYYTIMVLLNPKDTEKQMRVPREGFFLTVWEEVGASNRVAQIAFGVHILYLSKASKQKHVD